MTACYPAFLFSAALHLINQVLRRSARVPLSTGAGVFLYTVRAGQQFHTRPRITRDNVASYKKANGDPRNIGNGFWMEKDGSRSVAGTDFINNPVWKKLSISFSSIELHNITFITVNYETLRTFRLHSLIFHSLICV